MYSFIHYFIYLVIYVLFIYLLISPDRVFFLALFSGAQGFRMESLLVAKEQPVHKHSTCAHFGGSTVRVHMRSGGS